MANETAKIKKQLQSLKVTELQKELKKLGAEDISGMKKQELIKLIYELRAKSKKKIYATGVLEILPDGYGFLRSSDCSYLPGPDDIYVSHSQIKRFRLKTGNLVEGQVRPPKDSERFFALLRVTTINGQDPNNNKDHIHFDKLTPLYPEEHIKLETSDKDISMRTIDLLAPIGKGQRGLIVAQPKTGKTILLQKIANAISSNDPSS